MALQEFTDITGSKTWYDPTAKVVYTQGGTNPTQYKSPEEWNARQQKAHPERIKGAGNANPEAYTPPTSSFTGVETPSMFQGTGQQPTIDLNTMYETETNTPEIQQIKSEIEAKRSALTTATTKINDNPFYSEATRLGKIAKLNQTAQSELRDLEDKLATRMADAQTKINIATQQYNIDSQEYQNNLQKLNILISSGALLGASGNDLAQIGLATGLSSGMLEGIKSKMQQDAVNPQVITNTDDAGNVTVSVIDANSGNEISTRSLGKVGKATQTSGGTTNPFKPGTPTYIQAVNAMTQDLQAVSGSDRRVSPDDYVSYRTQWVQAGFSPSDFDSSFKNFVNPSHAQDYLVGYSSPSSANAWMDMFMGGNQ